VFGLGVIKHEFVDGRDDGAWSDVDHTNIFRGEFPRGGLHQQLDAAFAGTIRREAGPRDELVHAGHVDDHPTVGVGHDLSGLPQAQERPSEVGPQNSLPVLLRCLQQRDLLFDSSIVDQEVQAAECCDGFGHHPCDVGLVADVGLHGDRLARAGSLDARDDLVGSAFLLAGVIVHADIGTFAPQPLRGGFPDTA
jgi:hypothetical protein